MKERIVHDYELERPLMAPDPVDQWGDHGASGVGTRAARLAATKKKEPGWGKILLLLLIVAMTLFSFLVVINDLRGGKSGGDPNPTVVSAQSKIDSKLLSPDTIKRRLQKAGFEVDYLENTYDRTKHGYDVAATKIDGFAVQILAFPNQATTRDFVTVASGTGHVIVYGKLWAINFGQSQALTNKQFAEKVAGKLHAKFYWTPEGE